GGSLLATVDRTETPMGARLLRQWLLRPLVDTGAIARRQAAVAALVEEPARRAALRARLRAIGDLERLASRAALGQAHARDLVGLRGCLAAIPQLRAELAQLPGFVSASLGEEMATLPALATLLAEALEDDPPLGLKEGGLIRETFSAELEEVKGGAEERMARLELELFQEVRAAVAAEAEALLSTARVVAALDALASLAEVAHERGYVRPEVDDGLVLDIRDGRHPVLDAGAERPFTPNDLLLDPAREQVLILTGPNMSGKSVFMRQSALLVILAQVGGFVPARSARIGVVDRVLTRVGAQDNVARGQSTFLVEMVETASILHNATERSLILLDEVGRGTSTFDGLAIAWAVTEELHERGRGAKVLFATHYHELTALASLLPRVRHSHVAVKEWNAALS